MRKHEEDFKKEAVKLAKEIGISKAAEQLGIAKSTLSTWHSKGLDKHSEKHQEKYR